MLILLVENNIDELRNLQRYVSECYTDSDIMPFSDSIICKSPSFLNYRNPVIAITFQPVFVLRYVLKFCVASIV